MFDTIPLKNLVPSPRNVRRMGDNVADAQLAADIAARGLLQNLVVTPLAKPRGKFAVEAGGRRLEALRQLQADGILPADHAVACLVLARDNGASIEASLAENVQRLAMNPADECLAFGRLIEAGADVPAIARRFGLTVRFVEGRLRLANLAPVVFEALGAGEITLDAAQAYAATSDQERQAFVFEQLNASWGGVHPDSIRRMMVHATVSGADRRARYVGEDAYLAAGGRIERDLFADESEARWLDVALLERLAGDKLEVEAAWQQREHGYGFVRASLDAYVSAWQHDDLRRVALEPVPPSDEDQAAIAQLQERIDACIAALEDETSDDDTRQTAETQIDELSDAMRAITDKPPAIDSALRARVGVFLLVDEQGRPRLDRAVYELVGDGDDEADRSAEEPAGSAASGGGSGANPSGTGASDGKAGAEPRIAQRLLDELAMQRRDILSAHIARQPAFARDLAAFLMADRTSGSYWERSGSTLSANAPSDPVSGFATPDAAASIALAQANDALDRTWCEIEPIGARFDAFRELGEGSRDAWLAFSVARTLEASLFGNTGGRACAFHDHLGAALGIDVAACWRPTGANWFDRVPKSLALAALEEVGGPSLAQRHAKDKKPALADACERLFAGEGIVEAGVRALALAWVPPAMRFTPEDTAPPWIQDDGETCNPIELGDLVTTSDEGIALEQAPESGDPDETPVLLSDGQEAGNASGPVPIDQAA